MYRVTPMRPCGGALTIHSRPPSRHPLTGQLDNKMCSTHLNNVTRSVGGEARDLRPEWQRQVHPPEADRGLGSERLGGSDAEQGCLHWVGGSRELPR